MEDPVAANRSNPPPGGVIFFSVSILLTSLMHMHKLIVERDFAFFAFSYWPHWLFMIRYCFSFGMRILGLTAAVGMLRLKEISRKIMLGISWFTILTIYWKHPYEGFKNHTAYLDEHFGYLLADYGFPQFTFSQFTKAAMVGTIAWDLFFFSLMIYYLTRPAVKARFK
jgi:hypothetical protein